MENENQLFLKEARRNLYVLWLGVFMVSMGMSAVLPFLPLYISQLGDFQTSELNLLSSLSFAVSFLMSAIASPFWGRLADKYGCRPMLLRASFCLTFILALMAFVTSVWQLIVLRALQGTFGGFISNSIALVAIQTPKEKSGHSLAILSTGITAGTLIGPLMGALIASLVGYRGSFIMTSLFFFLIFFLVLFLVIERKKVRNLEKKKEPFSWKSLSNRHFLFGLL
ncbi:MAG: MFS transporter [Lactovum sp.]